MASISPDTIRAITLDVYGTLLDLGATFAPGFAGFLRSKGFEGDANDVVVSWEAAYLHESMVDTFLKGGRTPFEQVRRASLSQLLHRLRVGHTQDDIEELLTTKATPTLFPDVIDSLAKLRERYTLAVLSNGDLGSLERMASSLSVPVHRSISAEQADRYKPHKAVYLHAASELGLESNQVLHVAAHTWDVRGAKNTGMAGAYVNRYAVPYPAGAPDIEVPDLVELAAQIA